MLSLPYVRTTPCEPKVFLLLRALVSSSSAVVRASLEPRPSSPPDLRPLGRGPGKTSILFGEIRASASIFLRFGKSFAFRSWSTGTCYPASILKIICTIVVVCSLVGTFVMFYKEETSPCRLMKTTRPTSCKESFVCNCWVCSTLLP